MIVNIGTDILEISRMENVLRKHQDHFIQRVFTETEQAYCQSQKHPARHFAGRFAAKEAVLKALGTGWSEGIRWRDIEVLRNAKGDPYVALHSVAASIATTLEIDSIHISISHSDTVAMATCVTENTKATGPRAD